MRKIVIYLALASSIVIGSSLSATAESNEHEDSPMASPFACPVTQPNAVYATPDHFFGWPGSFQNDALWTTLWMWGADGVILPPGDGHITDSGAFVDMKWAWYRFKTGQLTITGQRLDAPAPPLEAWIPDGYGDTGFQVSGITFPTTGCWEITGHLGEDALTFVVWVAIEAVAPEGAP